jgi:DNA (cytosine-5)-methyltransferase 1
MLRALDLFCGAGGATKGLQRAGFHVTGVDLVRSPNYPGDDFWQQDCMNLHPEGLEDFALIWASPPCQAFCAYQRSSKVKPALNLIPQTRNLLKRSGRPYIIENVEGAREHLRYPITLCGSMFGLDVKRHRLFETHFPVETLECEHDVWTPRFPCATNRTNLRKTVEVGVYRIPLAVQRKAMGIEWMTLKELSQAIPPDYSEYLANEYLNS